jgi:hypothetical protein
LRGRLVLELLEQAWQQAEVINLVEAWPIGRRRLGNLVGPGEIVRHVYCAGPKLEHRQDVGAQRVPNHEEPFWRDRVAL